jgi:hypothetical protein
LPDEGAVAVHPFLKKVLIFIAIGVPVGLLENAFFGWAQMELGITNEHVEKAVRLAIQLGIPALTVAVAFYLYYMVLEHFRPTARPMPKLAPERQLKVGPEARKALGLDAPPPKYALPKDAEKIDIKQATNKQLGALCSALSSEIGEMLLRTMRSQPLSQIPYFHNTFATRFFWLYGEARRRGHRDSDLERYYERPESLMNVGHLKERLSALANRLPIYLDT